MKKVIFMLLPAFVSLLCSCGFNNNDNAGLKSGAVTIDSFLEVTKADFATELKKSNKAVFYESMITFVNTVDEDPGNIERVTNIIQDTSMCIQFVHQGGNTYITKNPSWWLKGLPINLDSIISLDSAIIRLQQANIQKPKSRYCVLRYDSCPTQITPAYIFGPDSTRFVRVDGLTGDVSEIK